jgi:CRP-like cAMP-binding protein
MVNLNLLRQFVPLASLNATDRAELVNQSRLGNYQPGQVLFNRGDAARTVIYLVSGEVELFSESGARLIKAGGEDAKHPISQGAKRTATATCIKAAQVLFIDRERLDLVLTWSQTGGVEVTELGAAGESEEIDWMTAMLQSEGFQRIPPGNIAQIFAAMQPVEFKAGETIIEQDAPGDYYYVITHGRCQVVRRDGAGGERELVQLGVGKCFGEEALVSGNPRNASVRAVSDCHVMRLAAADFARLLKTPLLKEISPEEVTAEQILIDVRLPEEFKRGRLPGAVNMPLFRLRELAAHLDAKHCYVIYCDTGKRSASATYLLCERGFDARVLSGGVPAEEMPIRG